MIRVNFSSTEYQFSHGHTPRGRGSWAFEVDCNTTTQKAIMLNPEFHGIVRVEDQGGAKVILWVKGSCLFTEAKARVAHFLRQHFTAVDVSVAP